MATRVHQVRVFVASPGDCDPERERVRSVATAVTETLGPQLGVNLRVDGWEAVSPDFGRPQDLINPLVDECDLFIGVLGHRWGTPTGSHSSGFLEEFERATARRTETGTPRIAVYFRDPPEAMLADPGRELRKIIRFRERLTKERVILYRTFRDLGDLEQQLWPLLSEVLVTTALSTRETSSDESSAGASRTETDVTAADLEGNQLDVARRQIADVAEGLINLARGTARKRPLDPDRLLLIALALSDDAGFLPTHPANRLYRRASDLNLAMPERTLWFRSLLADTGRAAGSREYRVLPGWAALSADVAELPAYVSDSDDLVAKGAVEVLSRLRARPAALWPAANVDQQLVTAASETWQTWLGRAAVASVAETYLASVVGKDDLPLLERITTNESFPDVEEIRLAVTGDFTALAHSVATKSYQPEWKVSTLQSSLSSAPVTVVTELVLGKHTPTVLRSAAAHELNVRHALTTEALQALLREPSLVDDVFAWVDDPGSEVGVAQVVDAVTRIDESTRNQNDLLDRVRAAISSTSDLLAGLNGDSSLSSWQALEWKSDPELMEVARDIFDTDGDMVVEPLTNKAEWRDNKKLFPYLRATSRRGALRILMRHKPIAEEDLVRLRKEVSADSIYTHQEALTWLAEHGTREDLSVLLARLESAYGETRAKVTAGILRVGGTGAARGLIESGEHEQPVAAVRALGDDADTTITELRELLYAPSDALRIAALDEIIARSNDEQLTQLLVEYPRARRPYYYNVLCEIDWILYDRAMTGQDE